MEDKKFPLKRCIYDGKDNQVVCRLCGNYIKKGERVVCIVTSSFYAIWKGWATYHEGCFLIKLQELFKGKIKLTKKGKIETIIERL